jgi:hypothetical protein
MAISGVGQSYYQNSVATTKSVNNTEKFALEKTDGTKELSEAEEMAIFKKEFYAEIEKIPKDRTIANVAINISEEAFRNMKADPKYREQMLSLIRRDMTGSQERSRLLQSWNNERLLSKASNAYEANVMTETVTDTASLLG